VEPLGRAGSDFEFVDDIFGRLDSAPVHSGPVEKRHSGKRGVRRVSPPGFPDGSTFRVTVFDGSYHDVDSNELSFKMAGRLAFKDAMTRARPTILEPVMNVDVYTPSDFAGDLMGRSSTGRARAASPAWTPAARRRSSRRRCRCPRCSPTNST